MPWPGLDWTQWTEMFSFDLSDLSWSIIYHLLKSGPTCPPLLCILSRSRLTSHDWCRQKAPLHLLPILYWLYSGAHRPPPTPGKLPGRRPGWKVISRAAYLLVQTSPGPGFQKIIILCWTVAIFLLNTSGEGLAGELSGIAAYFLDLFLFAPVSIPKFGYFVNILTLFDSLMVYTECILCFHQPIIDCKLNGRNERRSEPFFLSVTKYLTNPMQRLLRRLYISYYGLLRNFSLV